MPPKGKIYHMIVIYIAEILSLLLFWWVLDHQPICRLVLYNKIQLQTGWVPLIQLQDREKIRRVERNKMNLKYIEFPLIQLQTGWAHFVSQEKPITISLNLISIYHINFKTGTHINFFLQVRVAQPNEYHRCS